MHIFEELRQNLAFSLLDEDWKEKHQKLAKEFAHGEWDYHNVKAHHHRRIADFNAAAYQVVGANHHSLTKRHNLGNDVPAMKHYRQQEKRHRTLELAHRALRDVHPAPAGIYQRR